jgi:membrane protease YdiL (CAAX protease family)
MSRGRVFRIDAKEKNQNFLEGDRLKKFFIMILKILVFFFGWAILGGVINISSENHAIWRFWAEFVPFALIALLSALFWFIEKRRFSIVGWNKLLKNIVIGFLVGIIWIAVPILILYKTGIISFSSRNDVNMLFLLWGVSCFLNVIMQELLVRGYIYQLIKHNYNLPAAVVVTTAIFTALHGGAFEEGIVPVLCVVSMSLVMSLVIEHTGSLIVPIILHFIWNFVGAIIFNVVELADDYPHIFNATFIGNKILNGGNCLIEGSIVVLVVNLILIGIFGVLMKKDRRII